MADSRVRSMDKQLDNRFDRTFQFDFAGRLTANYFGNATDGIPFTQTAGYDAFTHLIRRNTTVPKRVTRLDHLPKE